MYDCEENYPKTHDNYSNIYQSNIKKREIDLRLSYLEQYELQKYHCNDNINVKDHEKVDVKISNNILNDITDSYKFSKTQEFKPSKVEISRR